MIVIDIFFYFHLLLIDTSHEEWWRAKAVDLDGIKYTLLNYRWLVHTYSSKFRESQNR